MTATEIDTMSAALDIPEVRLSNRDLQMIARQVTVPRGGRPPTEVELDDFARYCVAQRLNPFDRQIYLVPIGGRWQSFIGVHGRLTIAMRSGQVDGMEGPFYSAARTGVERDQPARWDELWDGDGPPHAAKFVVYRKGWTRFPVGIAPWRYYRPDTLSGTWKSNPALMLGYKAITRALNLVFPDVLPPAGEHEPDVDEDTSYSRDDGGAPRASTTPDAPPANGARPNGPGSELVDARGLAGDLGLTAGAVLVWLRRIAADLGQTPPTGLDQVDAQLVEIFLEEQASKEEPF